MGVKAKDHYSRGATPELDLCLAVTIRNSSAPVPQLDVVLGQPSVRRCHYSSKQWPHCHWGPFEPFEFLKRFHFINWVRTQNTVPFLARSRSVVISFCAGTSRENNSFSSSTILFPSSSALSFYLVVTCWWWQHTPPLNHTWIHQSLGALVTHQSTRMACVWLHFGFFFLKTYELPPSRPS